MIRKVLNKSFAHFSLCKPKQISLYSLKRKSQLNISRLYKFKIYYNFSNSGKVGSKNSAIDEANQLYSTYKWSDEFVQRIQQKLNNTLDNQIALAILEFYLLKIKQNIGINNTQYTKILLDGIDFTVRYQMMEKCNEWLQSLEEILSKNPSLGKNQTYTGHLQFKVSQLLQVYKVNGAQKWLELFIKKYQDFDQTSQVQDKQRFYTYLQLTDLYEQTKRNEQAFKYCKKLFDLIQKQKTKDVSKEGIISAIFKYGVLKMKLGEKEEALRAFNKIDKLFDWNSPANIPRVVKIIQGYLKLGFTQRASLLLQKLQNHYEKQKDVTLFKILYDSTLTERVTLYLMFQKYERLYVALKYNNQKQTKQFHIAHHVICALCQYKLGKRHDGQISLQKALMDAKSIKNPSSDFEAVNILFYVQLTEHKLKEELNSQSKQIIKKIKQILIPLMNKK